MRAGRIIASHPSVLDRRNTRLRRGVAAVTAVLLAATLVGEAPALAARRRWSPPAPPQVAGVTVAPVTATPRPAWTATGREVRGDRPVSWPPPAAVTVDLPAAAGGVATALGGEHGAGAPVPTGPAPVRAGVLPVYLAATSVGADGRDPGVLSPGDAVDPGVSRLGVRMLDRAVTQQATVDGLLVAVHRADGVRAPAVATVWVDYRGFVSAYGGDWATRLRLVELPACALSTPDLTECVTAAPVPSRNNPATGTVTGQVPLAASGAETVLALSAGPSGDNGDYTATSLSPASTWQVSAQTGDFSWSYALRMPPGVGGPQPSLALSYSSASIDGRTAASNSQASWIGDGWEMWPGFIERRYRGCTDDRDPVGGQDPNNKNLATGDQCWVADNATMSLNGRATELVRGGDGRWHGVSDDGSRIEQLTNPGFGNGDNDNEYWRVTTVDGTQYLFGGRAGAGSVWTVPVYGNHPGEPCRAATFAASRCSQAWRWNLDQVSDSHGNTMSYSYGTEEGAYGREANPGLRTSYHRGGYLSRIDYGTRSGSAAPAAARVHFDVADRCAPGATCTPSNPAAWPDTPIDQYCDPGSQCTDQLAVTFWTQKRLATIRTEVWDGGSSGYRPVESWSLRHEFLDAGTIEGKPMWLRGITRTGQVGIPVSDPEIVFNPGTDAAANRVDGPADGRTQLARFRMRTLTTESGAQIGIGYAPLECTRDTLPAPHANTQRCFPQYTPPPGGGEPTLDWFHKYVVTVLDVYDNTGGFVHEQTSYDYLDTPAWHHDDSELVPQKRRTWGQYRGYGRVRVRVGLPTGTQSATEYLFLRGMDGDHQPQPAGPRDVWVTDSQGTAVEDHPAYTGMTREVTVHNGPGGAWVSGSITDPWRHGPTATAGPLTAWMTAAGTTRTRTALATGGSRWTKTVTRFGTDNLLPYEIDDLGDEATATDDRCTRLQYTRNPGIHLLDKPSRTERVGVACAAAPARPGDVLTDLRHYYDDPAAPWGTPPVKGHVVTTEEADTWTGSTPVYQTVSRATYDDNGRAIESSDALDRRTTMAYTPSLAGPVTQVVATNPLGHRVVTSNEPAWGVPTRIVDANGTATTDPADGITDLVYDGLGRLVKVWQPGRDKASQSPNLEFGYLVRSTASTAVTTRTLLPNGTGYKTSTALYDGMMRLRQTQTQAPGGGRVITDTVHDSRGLVDWRSKGYHDTAGTAPNTTLYTAVSTVPGVTRLVHDGAGRPTAEIFLASGAERWRTSTGHGGDRSHVTPPAGGTATTTITDARGRTVELRQYKNPADLGSTDPTRYDATRYSHTDRDELATVVDPAGNLWRYSYDQRGRKTIDEDPDKGVTTMTYDAAGQLVTSRDARGVTLATTYDDLGRRKTLRDNSVTGPVRAEWVYDALPNGVGRQTKAIRYEPAGSTTGYTTEVTGYDVAGRPTGTKLTLPATETGLCASASTNPCEYLYANTYKADGQLYTTTMPAVADLPQEKLGFAFNDIGAPTTVLSALALYTYSVTYNKLGELTQRVLGPFGKRTAITYTIDEPTGRLTNTAAVPELQNEVLDLAYSYANAGNLTKISDTPAGGTADHQCYRYDHQRRLTEAWTPGTGTCTTNPTVAGLGGPAKYWHTYSYETTGNRRTETRHATTDTTATYTHPAPGAARPHAVTSVTTVTGATSTLDTYEYDPAGNTSKRVIAGTTSTLTWNTEGKLATVTTGGQTTSYAYDADGNRLIRRDPTGKTLYLPGGTELRYTTSGGAKTATRYYTHLDATIAVRTATALTWLVGDHHNTGEAAIKDTDLSVARRRTLPFGDPRGPAPAWWPGDKGFLGGTQDNTGLTHLGAREYDPKLGRFLSIDPVIDPADPRTLHGYAYGNNAPPTFTDPDGLNPFSKIASGLVKGWETVNVAPTMAVIDLAVGSYTTISDNITAAAHGDISWGDAATNIYTYKAEVEMAFLQGVVTAPVQTWNEITTATNAAADGDLEGAVAHGYVATADIALFVIPGAATAKGLSAGIRGGMRIADDLPPPAAARSIPCNSFLPGTAVLMADGSHKPIQDVQLDEQILATNPNTGQTNPEQVAATITSTGDKTLIDITVTQHGETAEPATVTATAEHPFWVTNRGDGGKWTAAKDLQTGDQLLNPEGSRVRVHAIAVYGAPATVYNLTIANHHTYYVGAAGADVLVHNSAPCPKHDISAPGWDPDAALCIGGPNCPAPDPLTARTGQPIRSGLPHPIAEGGSGAGGRVFKEAMDRAADGDLLGATVYGAMALVRLQQWAGQKARQIASKIGEVIRRSKGGPYAE